MLNWSRIKIWVSPSSNYVLEGNDYWFHPISFHDLIQWVVSQATDFLQAYASLCIMRVTPIRVFSGKGGFTQMKASFQKNWIHYLQEALGLGIFMISACFFSALLESSNSVIHNAIPSSILRNIISGILMGSTALFIFYSPFTSPSGSQINPAVTLSFLRSGKMCPWDAMFFILSQILGGVIAVNTMQLVLGTALTNPPVNSAVTVPGKYGPLPALITEFVIAFITMSMVLFTSEHKKLKKYTRIFAGCLVCAWVIVAGPISGFGMNPARSLASALPANIWTGFWIYLFAPVAGMLSATEAFLFLRNYRNDQIKHNGWKAIEQ